MNIFRTTLTPTPSAVKMAISDQILTIGACFADVLGTRLAANKLRVSANPFGNLYHPAGIHKMLTYLLDGKLPPSETYFQRDDLYLNYDFHSTFSALSLEDLENQIKNTILATSTFLLQTKWLVITYGTAWVYSLKESNETVANCHKLPAQKFTKSLWSVDQLNTSFSNLYTQLKKVNPSLRIILTVSPVRHLKDTLVLNSVSKAALRLACHTVAEKYDDVEYFPAYELLLDDLRDYRYYTSDMIHPTTQAEDYIWEHFVATYFNTDLQHFLAAWKDIQHALNHKPFHPTSIAHQQFLHTTLAKLETLKTFVNVDEEISFFNNQLLPSS